MSTLILFVDALPYDHVAGMPRLAAWPWRARLKPGFGYSINLHAELFAGLTPDEVGFFGEWTVDPARSPGRRHRRLLALLDRLLWPYIVNRGLQSLITRRYRPGHVMPNLPLARLADFALTGQKVNQPGFPHPTIFSRHPGLRVLEPAGHAKGRRDEYLHGQARLAIEGGAGPLYVPLPDLDGIGHAHRTSSPAWRDHLARLDRWVDGLAGSFLDVHPSGDVFVVSDHGMADVVGAVRFEPEGEIGQQGRGRYLYFSDSTLVRVWVYRRELLPAVAAYVRSIEPLLPVADAERREYGLANTAFGDIVAVLEEGLCFSPSTFARNIPAAMHGYHPDAASQHAILLHRGAHPPGRVVARTSDVFGVLDEALARG